MQRGGIRRQIANQHRGCRAGDTGHVVMFRQPVAVIATLFCKASKIQRMRKGLFGAGTFRDWRQVEYREWDRVGSHSRSLCYPLILSYCIKD